MGRLHPNDADRAAFAYSVSVSGTGVQAFPGPINGPFNVAISGTFVATLQFDKSYDGGTTWAPVSSQNIGTTATFTGPTTFLGKEVEQGVLYRVNCTAYTSGTATVRISG